MKSKILYWSFKILAILFGGFCIVFGEFDDSPGLQGIGLILIILVVLTIIRDQKRK